MSLIDTILSRSEFIDNPPVLLDIGAAGEIDPKWRAIARYSVCIAFDADDREMGYVVKESSGYDKLYVYNCIVTSRQGGEEDFFLTRSPQCSSLLEPWQERLEDWAFGDHFRVERRSKLKTLRIDDVLTELHLKKIDWFKTDSQGTDLRLFQSLGDEMIERVLAAEFEPGFIDAYRGEDKLWNLLAYMEKKPFWMTDLKVKGSQRISKWMPENLLGPISKKLIPALLKTSPGWGEVSYLNTFSADIPSFDKRDFLLGWVFAIVERQYGFAVEIAHKGYQRFNDPVFKEMKTDALARIRRSWSKVPFYIIKVLSLRLLQYVRLC